MLKKLGNNIKSQDQFGTRAIINIKKNQQTHKTLLGGILTINVKLCLLALIFFSMNSQAQDRKIKLENPFENQGDLNSQFDYLLKTSTSYNNNNNHMVSLGINDQ